MFLVLLVMIPAVFCLLLLVNLLYKLLLRLLKKIPWHVICWFCNSEFWLTYVERNSWTCPNCEQYNGFTKDGDYNKKIDTYREQSSKRTEFRQSSSPKNGLCRMCNINQELKVKQLANFVPVNVNKYYEELNSYRNKLEKAYKLCSPCEKVLQLKLHKDKKTILRSKIIERKTIEKRNYKENEQHGSLKMMINSKFRFVAMLLTILVSVECLEPVVKCKDVSETLFKMKWIFYFYIETTVKIVKTMTLYALQLLRMLIVTGTDNINLDLLALFNSGLNVLTQNVLGISVCLLLIIFGNTQKGKYNISVYLLWCLFIAAGNAHHCVETDPLIMSFIKLASTVALLLVYQNNKTITMVKRQNVTPKQINYLTTPVVSVPTSKTSIEEEDIHNDTDDDVSLRRFGLFGLTDSSSDTDSPTDENLVSATCFSPKNTSVWSKPKLNTSFNYNPVYTRVPTHENLVSRTCFSPKITNVWSKSKLNASFNNNPVYTRVDKHENLVSGTCFSPKNTSVWSKPKLNTSFNYNPVYTRVPKHENLVRRTCFSPRNASLLSRPKLNTSFNYNPFYTRVPTHENLISRTCFSPKNASLLSTPKLNTLFRN